jgi:hypothetical protein
LCDSPPAFVEKVVTFILMKGGIIERVDSSVASDGVVAVPNLVSVDVVAGCVEVGGRPKVSTMSGSVVVTPSKTIEHRVELRVV